MSVRFSPDGRWVASSAKDGQMLFWDLVAGPHSLMMAIIIPTHPVLIFCLPRRKAYAYHQNGTGIRVFLRI